MLAIFGVDHAGKKTPRRVARAGAKFGQHARDTLGLQSCEFEGEHLAGWAHIEEPLAAIVGAFLLHDITFVDELLKHAAERLLVIFKTSSSSATFIPGLRLTKCNTR